MCIRDRPYEVIRVIPPVNYVLRRTPKSKPFVVHADKLKKCYVQSPETEADAADKPSPVEPDCRDTPADRVHQRKRQVQLPRRFLDNFRQRQASRVADRLQFGPKSFSGWREFRPYRCVNISSSRRPRVPTKCPSTVPSWNPMFHLSSLWPISSVVCRPTPATRPTAAAGGGDAHVFCRTFSSTSFLREFDAFSTADVDVRTTDFCDNFRPLRSPGSFDS